MIPVILNREARNADAGREALARVGGFDVRACAPPEVEQALRTAVGEGHPRIAVAGGDGTVASAARLVASRDVELAIIPAGTLNHFAADHGIPDDLEAAVVVAAEAGSTAVDAARVNDRLFINTSSVGAYARFVRLRDALERRIGYAAASVVAALRVSITMHRAAVEVATPQGARIFRSPLIFVGVGQRELRHPLLGGRVPDGVRALHVMVVEGRRTMAILRLAMAAVARGSSTVDDAGITEVLTPACSVKLRRGTRVATDGELVHLDSPLRFEFVRDAFRLVRPAADRSPAAASGDYHSG